MIGSSDSSSTAARDSSFLCLLAIYAAHVVLFHVLDVAPRPPVGGGSVVLHQQPQQRIIGPSLESHRRPQRIGTEHNNTEYENGVGDARGTPTGLDASDVLSGQLHHEVFTRSSQLHWDSPMDHSMTSYPKIDFDFLFLLTWIHRLKSVFATVALSSSTWGIISGCAIFLLTYTDRDNTLET